MSVTRIDIINDALGRLGIAPLQSDAVTAAEKPVRAYDAQLRVMLGLKSWSFTRGYQKLGRLTDPPAASPWKYQFQLPADREGAIAGVFDTEFAAPFTSYEISGDKILADVEELWVRYRRQADPALFSGLFRECLTMLVTAELALAMRENDKLRDSMRAEVLGDPRNPSDAGLVAVARAEDARQEPSQVAMIDGGPLIDAHQAGGRGRFYDGRRW